MIRLFLLVYLLGELFATYLAVHYFGFWDTILLIFFSSILGLHLIFTHVNNNTVEQSPTILGAVEFSPDAIHRWVKVVGSIFFTLPALLIKSIGLIFLLPGTRHLIVWLGAGLFRRLPMYAYWKPMIAFSERTAKWSRNRVTTEPHLSTSGPAKRVPGTTIIDLDPKKDLRVIEDEK